MLKIPKKTVDKSESAQRAIFFSVSPTELFEISGDTAEQIETDKYPLIIGTIKYAANIPTASAAPSSIVDIVTEVATPPDTAIIPAYIGIKDNIKVAVPLTAETDEDITEYTSTHKKTVRDSLHIKIAVLDVSLFEDKASIKAVTVISVKAVAPILMGLVAPLCKNSLICEKTFLGVRLLIHSVVSGSILKSPKKSAPSSLKADFTFCAPSNSNSSAETVKLLKTIIKKIKIKILLYFILFCLYPKIVFKTELKRGIDIIKIDALPASSAFEARELCPKSRQVLAVNSVRYAINNAFIAVLKYFPSIPDVLISNFISSIAGSKRDISTDKIITAAATEIKKAYSCLCCLKIRHKTAVIRQNAKILSISIVINRKLI